MSIRKSYETYWARREALGQDPMSHIWTNQESRYVHPFQLYGNVWYVGDSWVCVHLIDTGDGLLLIDSGNCGATAMLVNAIWEAGFKPSELTQRERIMQYIQNRYGTEPEYLWKKFPDHTVFRQPASRKWFAILADIPRKRLGLEGDEPIDMMDVKCGPILVGSLLAQEGYCPAYHMCKGTWIAVILDDSVSDEDIYPLVELSYDSVVPKTKKGQPGPDSSGEGVF